MKKEKLQQISKCARVHSGSHFVAMDLEPWYRAPEKRSDVWKHLFCHRENKRRVKCAHCVQEFSLPPNMATSAIKYHLEKKHKIIIARATTPAAMMSEASSSSSSRASSLTRDDSILAHFPKRDQATPELVVARLTALDRISFSTLASSKEIREGFLARNLKIPATPQGVKKLVMGFASSVQDKVKVEIKQRRDGGEKFTLSFDEWTSKRNRRYMCLNLHCSDKTHYGLGMIRVNGSCPAEKALEIIQNKLTSFDIVMSRDVFAVVTDGATVMKKLGRIMEVTHQLCHSHGIHLAIGDVLYKKPLTQEVSEEEEDVENEDDEDEQGDWTEEVSGTETMDFSETYTNTIKKVRKIVLHFKRSPKQNDALQALITADGEHEKTLILDTKTRWNSMLHMLKRFLEIKAYVIRALVDHGSFHLFPSQEELDLISHLSDALEVVEVSAQALGRSDSDLAKADTIFEFLIKSLDEQRTSVGHALRDSIVDRITERRDSQISGLFLYLTDPGTYGTPSALQRPSINELSKTARDLFLRLFKTEEDTAAAAANEETAAATNNEGADEIDGPPPKLSKAQELENLLSGGQKTGERKFATSNNLLYCLKREMAVFESNGVRPSSLERIYKAMLTLPPSSIEAERSFSAAGLFVTKLRTSLNDDTIDKLCFLRSYLMKNAK